jgi:hypothetical protein
MPTTPPTAPPATPAETRPRRRGATGVLLRFISCGLLALGFGLLWRFTLAPKQVHTASALAGILFLLLGFILGGLLWYVRDVRLRARNPEAVDDERLVFSFVVFALMPLAVLVVVGLVWLLALLIGSR